MHLYEPTYYVYWTKQWFLPISNGFTQRFNRYDKLKSVPLQIVLKLLHSFSNFEMNSFWTENLQWWCHCEIHSIVSVHTVAFVRKASAFQWRASVLASTEVRQLTEEWMIRGRRWYSFSSICQCNQIWKKCHFGKLFVEGMAYLALPY